MMCTVYTVAYFFQDTLYIYIYKLCKVCMYKGAGHSTFVTVHSVPRHSQIFVTVKICKLVRTANHIQYK